MKAVTYRERMYTKFSPGCPLLDDKATINGRYSRAVSRSRLSISQARPHVIAVRTENPTQLSDVATRRTRRFVMGHTTKPRRQNRYRTARASRRGCPTRGCCTTRVEFFSFDGLESTAGSRSALALPGISQRRTGGIKAKPSAISWITRRASWPPIPILYTLKKKISGCSAVRDVQKRKPVREGAVSTKAFFCKMRVKHRR